MKVSEMEARGTKTLVESEPLKELSWLGWILVNGVRVVLLTVLWAGLGMGVGLFCGIVGILIVSAVQHQAADMSLAYRHISVPVAVVSGSCAFLWNAFRMAQAAMVRRRAQTQQP